MKQLTKEQIEETVREYYEDPVLALRALFPKWFPDKIPWFHRAIMAIILRRTDFLPKYGELDLIVKHFVWREDPWDEKSPAKAMFEVLPNGKVKLLITQHTLIMLPRGFSKTTLLNALLIYMILYKIRENLLYASETATHAERQLQNVKKQFESNELILALFGPKKPSSDSSNRWTNEFIQTADDASLTAKGSGGQIRGTNIDGVRPQVIIFDDIEDREDIKNDTTREKIRTWAMQDAMPALQKRDPNAFVVVLGTLMHSDSVMVTFSRDPRFNTVVFGATLPDGSLLWPEQMGYDQLTLEKSAFARAGNLSGFYMEYFNRIRAPEGAKFKGPFVYGLPASFEDIYTSIAIDPALSEAKKASDCVLAVAGMHAKTGKIYVLEMIGRRGMTPREQVDHYFELSKKWKCTQHGVESIGYQAALVHLLREEMFRKKHYFEITPLTHSQKKEERIEGILQPRYANGYVLHAEKFHKLETQLLDWPKGGMDWPDALAMAVALLDPYAAAAADPTVDLGDDEYTELESNFGRWAS